ncbi:hypothetical protein [Virgibacillus sp. DJP39]|uniref:hypothetical protein n=1 Tax=Virgibacillus sp. DJP39 TaxID=3409790 RepID=UPI003BB7B283
MIFSVSEEAAKWYKKEMGLHQGDYLRFFVKLYGGIPTVRPSYFLGLSIGEEGEIGIEDVVEGVTFYFTAQDIWFLKGYDLNVEMGGNEVEFIFNPKE